MRTALAILLLAFCATAQRHNIILMPNVTVQAITWQGRPALVMVWNPQQQGHFVGFETPPLPPAFGWTWQLDMSALAVLDSRPCAVGAEVSFQSYQAGAVVGPFATIPANGFMMASYLAPYPACVLPYCWSIGQKTGPAYGGAPSSIFWQLWYGSTARQGSCPFGINQLYPELAAAIFFVTLETQR